MVGELQISTFNWITGQTDLLAIDVGDPSDPGFLAGATLKLGEANISVGALTTTRIACNGDLAAWLPLLLPVQPVLAHQGRALAEPPADEEFDDLRDYVEDCLVGVPPVDRIVIVNDKNWIVLQTVDDSLHIVPLPRGDCWPDKSWADWGWSETMATMGGADTSEVGALTTRVAISVSKHDEGEYEYQLILTESPAHAVAWWLLDSYACNGPRSLWPGDQPYAPDPILRMFFTLTRERNHPGEFWGGWFFDEDEFGATETTQWGLSIARSPGPRKVEAQLKVRGVVPEDYPSIPEDFHQRHPDTESDSQDDDEDERDVADSNPDLRKRVRLALDNAVPPSQEIEPRLFEAQQRLAPGSPAEADWRTVLGAAPDTDNDHLSHVVALREKGDPALSTDLWTYKRLLEQLATARIQETAAESLGWPEGWPRSVAPLWVELEGTAESARAWAKAGWGVEEILTRTPLHPSWDRPVSERVKVTDPPARPRSALSRRGSETK
jgi:hypothetical protein